MIAVLGCPLINPWFVVIETKGGDPDNTDSEGKARLGKQWATLAGNKFRYMMVFEGGDAAYAHNLDKAIELLAKS